MKKTYISPRLFVINAETSEMICVSKEKYTLTSGTQWGGEGEYAPVEWKNEGFIDESDKKFGFDIVRFGDEGDDDLPSR